CAWSRRPETGPPRDIVLLNW
nr:immunoglobulin heavy chain junction region [Macaca mulatta]MOW19124.1 immunoglobulin heavy chain junction region [Macaca mulatta]MOW19271.1 immunoglobulin heavy chain junction region [Macaca mulatta]MOW19486.1 immunoglobulin heavy chain junction region [Macaca mulatta]MOW19993.1 immunoglobulin heavy chain junction region [Macaca mulatta]